MGVRLKTNPYYKDTPGPGALKRTGAEANRTSLWHMFPALGSSQSPKRPLLETGAPLKGVAQRLIVIIEPTPGPFFSFTRGSGRFALGRAAKKFRGATNKRKRAYRLRFKNSLRVIGSKSATWAGPGRKSGMKGRRRESARGVSPEKEFSFIAFLGIFVNIVRFPLSDRFIVKAWKHRC